MRLVVDASVALKWVVDEPDSEVARALLVNSLLAPDLIIPECTNALWTIARRGGITEGGLIGAIGFLASVGLHLAPTTPLMPRALDMARQLDHPAYDCFYLALAEREHLQCLTGDERFAVKVARSAWSARVSLLTPAAKHEGPVRPSRTRHP